MCQCKSQESQGNYGNCPACAPKKTIPHVHAALIKAWADGAIIQGRHSYTHTWEELRFPVWNDKAEYRIKPEPSPAIVMYSSLSKQGTCNTREYFFPQANILHTYDGETGKLKAVELL